MPTSVTQRVFKNTAVLVAGRFFSRIFQFFLFIYAARKLGVDQFGIFSYAFAVVNLLSVAMDLGISHYIVQQSSRDNKKTALFVGGGLMAKTALVAVGFVLIMAVGLFMQKDQITLWALFFMGVYASFDNIGMVFNSTFEAHEQMEYQAIIIAVSNFIMSVAGFILLYLFNTVILFCLTFAFGALLRMFSSIVWSIKNYGAPSLPKSMIFPVELIRKGLPFALVSIFVSIYYYIDTLILSMYCSNDIVGYYNAAYRLLEAPLFLISSVTTAIFPAASRLYGKDVSDLNHLVTKSIEKTLAFSFSIALAVSFLSKEVIVLIYGENYLPSASVLPMLMYSVAVIMPSTICGTTIRAIDRQSVSAWVTGLGAVLNLILNIIVIPKYSFQGAAWTTLITEVSVLSVNLYLAFHYLGPVITMGTVFRILGLNGAIFVFLYSTASFGLIARIIGCTLLFIPLMTAFGVLRTDEIKKIISGKTWGNRSDFPSKK